MAKPRRVLPGICYLLSRRCSERRLFLRPDREIKHIFEYLLGYLAKQYGVEIHAYVVMSNHYHLVLTDVEGRLPDFQRDFNSLLARAINVFREREESVWDRNSYNAVSLTEDGDVVSKIGYTLANPVAARLVDRAREWEGATSASMEFGDIHEIVRPKAFFGEKMPETVELELKRPRCYEAMSGERLQQLIGQDVARREESARMLGEAMGMGWVMRQDWNSSPNARSRRVGKERGIRPTVAAANKWARIEALQQSKEWLRQYKEALAKFVAGNRDVEFPRGTWQMCARLRCNRVAA